MRSIGMYDLSMISYFGFRIPRDIIFESPIARSRLIEQREDVSDDVKYRSCGLVLRVSGRSKSGTFRVAMVIKVTNHRRESYLWRYIRRVPPVHVSRLVFNGRIIMRQWLCFHRRENVPCTSVKEMEFQSSLFVQAGIVSGNLFDYGHSISAAAQSRITH